MREEGYATDLLASDVERLIAAHDFSERPMFLYHAMFAPHAPFQASDERMKPFAHVENPQRRQLLGLLSAMDDAFGRTISALEKAGQIDNTLVVFLSDNGGPSGEGRKSAAHHAALNEPLRAGKGTYYECGVRVPAFAFWPGRIQPGLTTDALAHVTDLFITFARLADAPLPDKPLDGFDLAPVLFSKAASSGRTEIPFILEDSERLRRGAIIDWPWKLRRTATPNGPWIFELFNVADDPNEAGDGHRTAKDHPELTSNLSSRLDILAKDAPPALWKQGDGNAPPDWKANPIHGPDALHPKKTGANVAGNERS